MTKTIRKTYHRDVSIGILLIIFATVFFLSGQLFEKQQPGLVHIYLGMGLVSVAVIVMILILWEEILFPVTIKPEKDGLTFRNHRTKLKIQALIYLLIPAIVGFLYFSFEVNVFRFFAWAGVCLILPVVGKLVSGINNYHDFLTLTTEFIQYKNNEKEGTVALLEVKKLELVKDKNEHLSKLVIHGDESSPLTIDLDEMELEAFYDSIEDYIENQYQGLLSSVS